MSSFFSDQLRRRKYSVQRLRNVYSDLLSMICVSESYDTRQWEEQSPLRRLSKKFIRPRRMFSDRKGSDKTAEDDDDTLSNRPNQREKEKNEVAIFYSLAATRSTKQDMVQFMADTAPEGESDDPDSFYSAQNAARTQEQKVVRLIRSIGEIVINAVELQQQQAARDGESDASYLPQDDVFEYFSEKNILLLFVDIVRAKPLDLSTSESSNSSHRSKMLHGVVWSAKVKAEALHTVALLISSLRDPVSLYYVLSQNCINHLVTSMLPFSQWTDPALDQMLPPYVDLLKHLALELSDAPDLFCFFVVDLDAHHGTDAPEASTTRKHFPLFSATLETGTSSYAESNSFVHATCLNLIVDLMQIPDSRIQKWVKEEAQQEQLFLANHLSELLLKRYSRMVNLTHGPVVDAIRSDALAGQMDGLNDQMDILNDIFDCNIRGLTIRLCEAILGCVVAKIWQDIENGYSCTHSIASPHGQMFMGVGLLDADVIPERDAMAQVGAIFLSIFFTRLRYKPLVRMLAIALLHPRTTTLWSKVDSLDATTSLHLEQYKFMPALHEIAEGTAKEDESRENFFRSFILESLEGDFGEWRTVSAAIFIESVLRYADLDIETVILLQIFPFQKPAHSFDGSIAGFLTRDHTRHSEISTVALECVSSLAMHYVQKGISFSLDTKAKDQASSDSTMMADLKSLSVYKAILQAREIFYGRIVETRSFIGTDAIFVETMELTTISLYKPITVLSQPTSRNARRATKRFYAYQLSQHGSRCHSGKAECLIRRLRGPKLSDTEIFRWNIQMALHLRAVSRVLERLFQETITRRSSGKSTSAPKLALLDKAEELGSVFSTMESRPSIGSPIELRGLTTFPFTSGVGGIARDDPTVKDLRMLAEGMGLQPLSKLIAVFLQPYLLIAKPAESKKPEDVATRGTILCCIPLLHIIGVASDGDWLHVAVRHDNVKALIKNGNMAMRFANVDVCSSVQQNIVQYTRIFRRDIVQQTMELLKANGEGVEQPLPITSSEQHASTKSKDTLCLEEKKLDDSESEDKKSSPKVQNPGTATNVEAKVTMV